MKALTSTGNTLFKQKPSQPETKLKRQISYPLESREHHPGWPNIDREALIQQTERAYRGQESDQFSIRSVSPQTKATVGKKGDIVFTIAPCRKDK